MSDTPEQIELNPYEAMLFAREMLKAGQYAEALPLCTKLVEFDPTNFDANHNIGLCMTALRHHEDALQWYDRANSIAITELVLATCNRAVAFGELGDSAMSLRILDDLLTLYPDHPQALYNRAVLHMQTEQFEDAIRQFNNVILIDPKQANEATYGKGFSNLVLGHYAEGFRDFECRDKPSFEERPEFGTQWTGDEDINGKTVLVMSEMGSGDTIQFARYLPLMVNRGAHVKAIINQPGLIDLLAPMHGVEFFNEGEEPASADHWVNLMSLAWCFRTTEHAVPAPLKLHYDATLLDQWATIIPPDRMNIGLCWSGNPISKYDKHRSIPFALLNSLIEEYPNAQFYSFQQQVREDDREAFGTARIIDIGPQLTNFKQTSHAMRCLDLMVTCDTSVAHMAGTVGIPTWIMLTKFRTYWLWQRDSQATPWYPSMQFFRQTINGDWSEVIERIKREIGVCFGQVDRKYSIHP